MKGQQLLDTLTRGLCGADYIPRRESSRVAVDGRLPDRDGSPASTVLVFQSELDFISRCILDYPRVETGGQLFGYWTATGVPVVLFAIGPGPNANHSKAFFNQDIDYLVRIGELLISKYGLQHIGEWHSHHQLGLACPSGHDASTMVNCIRRQNLGRFLLCIGNCTDISSTMNAFNFSQKSGYDYIHSVWDVKSGTSPFRQLISADCDFAGVIIDPCTKLPCHGSLLTTSEHFESRLPFYAADYWLKEKTNNLALKKIVDQCSSDSLDGECAVQMDSHKCVHLIFPAACGRIRIVFPEGFPKKPPIVTANENELDAEGVAWTSTGNIYLDFFNYYDKLMKGKEIDTETIPSGIAGAQPVSDIEPVQVPGYGYGKCPFGDCGAY